MTVQKAMNPQERLATGISGGNFTTEELLSHYCTCVYAKLKSYEATARRLGLDRRTVKSKINLTLLAELKSLKSESD